MTIELSLHTHDNRDTKPADDSKVGEKFALCARTRRYTYLTAWMFGTHEQAHEALKKEQKAFKDAEIKVVTDVK